MRILATSEADGSPLAELRALAMRESLEAIGRFDATKVRQRFLQGFDTAATKKIVINDELAAFFTVLDRGDHLYIDHLYIHPIHQGKGLGSAVLRQIKEQASIANKPLRLGALKGSRSNQFYLSHQFVSTHEEEFDIYYECKPHTSVKRQ